MASSAIIDELPSRRSLINLRQCLRKQPRVVHTAIVPLTPAHSALHVAPVLLQVRRHPASMPPLVAPTAGRHDVCRVIAATVALRHEVFCGAFQLSCCAQRDPKARYIGFGIFTPHQDAAKEAPSFLTLKGRMGEHDGIPIGTARRFLYTTSASRLTP